MAIDELYDTYLQALKSGNRVHCTQIVQSLLEDNMPIPDLYQNFFQRGMYDIGVLWEKNQVSVAVEHIATAITEGLMAQVYPKLFDYPKNGHTVVVACISQEFHQIGAKMVADICELEGWDSFFVGANTPNDHLLSLIGEKSPELIALSVSLSISMPNLINVLTEISAAFPMIPIIVGGQGVIETDDKGILVFSQVSILKTITQLQNHLKTIGEIAA